MTQVVYYGYLNHTLGADLEPLSSYVENNIFNQPEDRRTGILACPALKQHIKNVFVVKSNFQYNFEWDGNGVKSSLYDQEFFNENITVRNVSTGFLSYTNPKICFSAESDDLMITQESAFFHDNDITRNCHTIPGTFNIGKHLPRPLELSMKIKQPSSVKIRENDALYYVRFHTNENIIFKKFIFSDQLQKIMRGQLVARSFTQGFKDLDWWYNLVKRNNLKKFILKEIKKNLL